ncbi:pilus assembly protein TadG-related protein [Arthrobacter sp. TMP15]|uniref:pilus assembly protein TadG-related protein n=1 Tax=Arthrobacter sp. TMP15 TaxID=3140789 RepID=UPI0031BA63E4
MRLRRTHKVPAAATHCGGDGEPLPEQNSSRENGHVMVLLIGYVLLTLLLVTVVAAAGSLYIGHKKLLSIADSAALAAADTFELSGGDAGRDPGTLLTDHGVLAAAQNYLSGLETPQGLGGIVLDSDTGAGDGHSAHVGMSAVVHPLFINFLVPEGISISVTSTARAHLVL